MKFSQEEIKKGIVIAFGSQSQIARTASEAEEVINSFTLHNANLVVNGHAKKFLASLFMSEEIPDELKTTGCSVHPIRFYPALAETIEEHNRLYRALCDAEKERRIKEAQERKRRRQKDFGTTRKGWYRVSVEVTALTFPTLRRRQLTNSGYCLAESKIDAYKKFVSGIQGDCAKRGLTLESYSAWDGSFTEVSFVGEKTDDGFSLSLWNILEMEKLAEIINDSDDFPLREVQETIERNGWTEGVNDYDICYCDDASLEFNWKGEAFVREFHKTQEKGL